LSSRIKMGAIMDKMDDWFGDDDENNSQGGEENNPDKKCE